jgi:hypothetical protein
MLIPLGILASAGGVLPPIVSDYELISTTVLGSATPFVVFSNLGDYASTYKHLQIRAVIRGATDSQIISMRINGNTGSNYAIHSLISEFVGGSLGIRSEASTSQTSMTRIGFQAPSGSTANAFGANIIDILDPYAAKNKTIRTFGGQLQTGGGESVGLISGLYNSTDSVTSITLLRLSGDFATNSRFSIYGIR